MEWSLRQLVENWVLHAQGDWWERYMIGVWGIVAGGCCWAVVWWALLSVVHHASLRWFAAYSRLNTVQKADWTSRWVAMVFITLSTYRLYVISRESGHYLLPLEGTESFEYSRGTWVLKTQYDENTLYELYLTYIIFFGYELYDLKNCIDIKMYSGVLHHLVLLVIFPTGWSVTTLSILAVWMVATTYLSNIPAHIRSFLVHTGYRDTTLYKWNKWAWWISYIVLRLFSIPWFSAQMWFMTEPMKVQGTRFVIAWYFSAMAVHYLLSVYWFVEMTKTMFPVDPASLKRVGSYPIFPREKDAKAPRSSPASDDEGGQKFD